MSMIKKIEEILAGDIDLVKSQRGLGKNCFRLVKSFFYRHGMSATILAATCEVKLRSAGISFEILDKGEHWHAFVGGSKTGSSQDSFFWVDIKIIE